MHTIVGLLLERHLAMRNRVGLKGQRRRDSILSLTQGVGQSVPLAGHCPIVQRCDAQRQNGQHSGHGERPDRQGAGPGHKTQVKKNSQREEHRFIGSGQHMQGEPQPQRQTISNAGGVHHSRQRAKDQAPGHCGQRTAPVSVGPLIQRAEQHDRHPAPQQCPSRRGPAPQHPVTEGTK